MTTQQDLYTLEAELTRVTSLASQVDALSKRLQHATSGNLLGTVSTPDLAQAQHDYEEAVAAISRKATLQQVVAEARRDFEYGQAQEKQQFIRSIHDQFVQVRERYIIESKKLLEIFREMHKLNLQSQGMRSTPLLTAKDYALDLPVLRRDADSELFTIGQMLRDGGY